MTGVKKCGCHFQLKGMKLFDTGDDWVVEVVCGVHNHLAATYLEGHSFPGRLRKDRISLVIEMSKTLARPGEMLQALKQRDPRNCSTLKTVYNARDRYKVAEKARRSQMQQLLSKLSERKNKEWHRSCYETEIVKDLLWAHPVSIDLLHAFPRVLLMDCTYKTNRYRFPLLQIVGITST